MSHTFAKLAVQPEFFAEVSQKLKDAGYGHAFIDDGLTIDMHGIALTSEIPHPSLKKKFPIVLYFENQVEGEDFIRMVKSVHPNLVERKVI